MGITKDVAFAAIDKVAPDDQYDLIVFVEDLAPEVLLKWRTYPDKEYGSIVNCIRARLKGRVGARAWGCRRVHVSTALHAMRQALPIETRFVLLR